MVKCCAPKCFNASYNKTPEITFHRFPKNEDLKNLWIMKLNKKDWQPKSSSVLCSAHFDSNLLCRRNHRIILVPGAIPTIFKHEIIQKNKENVSASPNLIKKRNATQVFGINYANIPVPSVAEKIDQPSCSYKSAAASDTFTSPSVSNASLHNKENVSASPNLIKKRNATQAFGINYANIPVPSVAEKIDQPSCSYKSAAASDTFTSPSVSNVSLHVLKESVFERIVKQFKMQNMESDSEDELPPGWEEKPTEDGNIYFVNTCTNKIQWTHPRTGRKKVIPEALPFGWTKSTDENGTTIYIQKETGNKTYVDPRLAFAKEQKNHVHDFRQRFDGSSTAYQVLHGVDLSGKYALITGSNVGIGYETAKSMARHGCSILFANRNMEATQQAIDEIVKETKCAEDNLKAIHLDLSSLQSVRRCALAVKTLFSDHLHFLILNAGVFGTPYLETEDHFEQTFQVNHLSHMYLALLLEPLLKKHSRVIFVSSESHRFANLKNVFNQQNLMMTKDTYSSMMAYNNSKLYNVVTAKVLSEEWRSKGISVNSLHPGNMVFTSLSKSWWFFRFIFFIVRPFTKSLQQAAATTVYVATADELRDVTGLYFNNCFYCEESALARDRDIATEVFAISLKLIVSRMGAENIQSYLDKYTTKLETQS